MGIIAVLLVILIFVVASQRARAIVASIFDRLMHLSLWGGILIAVLLVLFCIYCAWGWLHEIFPNMWSFWEIVLGILGLFIVAVVYGLLQSSIVIFLRFLEKRMKFVGNNIVFNGFDTAVLFVLVFLGLIFAVCIFKYPKSAAESLVDFGVIILVAFCYLFLRIYLNAKKNNRNKSG